MFDEIPELDRKGLRDFGLITGALIALIFGLLFPYQLGLSWPLWPWIVFAVLGLMALISPMALNPIYTIWMKIGGVIGSVMSRIILGIVFFLVVTPIGLIMRAMGNDPMRRELNESETSYRESISENKSNSFDKPY